MMVNEIQANGYDRIGSLSNNESDIKWKVTALRGRQGKC
jgi:hypothetical protein